MSKSKIWIFGIKHETKFEFTKQNIMEIFSISFDFFYHGEPGSVFYGFAVLLYG